MMATEQQGYIGGSRRNRWTGRDRARRMSDASDAARRSRERRAESRRRGRRSNPDPMNQAEREEWQIAMSRAREAGAEMPRREWRQKSDGSWGWVITGGRRRSGGREGRGSGRGRPGDRFREMMSRHLSTGRPLGDFLDYHSGRSRTGDDSDWQEPADPQNRAAPMAQIQTALPAIQRQINQMIASATRSTGATGGMRGSALAREAGRIGGQVGGGELARAATGTLGQFAAGEASRQASAQENRRRRAFNAWQARQARDDDTRSQILAIMSGL